MSYGFVHIQTFTVCCPQIREFCMDKIVAQDMDDHGQVEECLKEKLAEGKIHHPQCLMVSSSPKLLFLVLCCCGTPSVVLWVLAACLMSNIWVIQRFCVKYPLCWAEIIQCLCPATWVGLDVWLVCTVSQVSGDIWSMWTVSLVYCDCSKSPACWLRARQMYTWIPCCTGHAQWTSNTSVKVCLEERAGVSISDFWQSWEKL